MYDPAIENALDKILVSELNQRFVHPHDPLSPAAINELIEKKNRDIVRIHQQGKAAESLSALFQGAMQIKPGGTLYLTRHQADRGQYQSYLDKIGRLKALLYAATNAVGDEDLISLVYRKEKEFEEICVKAGDVADLTYQAEQIAKDAAELDGSKAKDLAAASRFLEQISPLYISVKGIEARYFEIRQEMFLDDIAQNLKRKILTAEKIIDSQRRRAVQTLFNQARSVFHQYQSLKTDVSHLDAFMEQKTQLVDFLNLLDAAGEDSRKKQIKGFVKKIESTIDYLQKRIESLKQEEEAQSKENEHRIDAAYQKYLKINQLYSEGALNTERKQKKSVEKLKKYRDILKAQGQRIKAREIDRFLNSTNLGKTETVEQSEIPPQYLFYKQAFFTILPVTILLFLIVLFLLA